MTSDSQLNQQYDRITELLRQQSTPVAAPLSNADYYTQAIGAFGEGGPAAFIQGIQGLKDKSVADQRQAQSDTLNREQGILSVFEAKKAAGDANAKALDDKIQLFTGGDPEGAAIFLQALHDDPEQIDPGNSFQVLTKLAGIAKQTGYVSPILAAQKEATALDLQAKRLGLSKTQAEINELNAPPGADGGPADVQSYQFFHNLTPEQQAEFISVKRASPTEVLQKKLSEQGAKEYGTLFGQKQTVNSIAENIVTARDALSKAQMTGPLFGRLGAAASDPDYVNWTGAQNTLALQARVLLQLPASGFSDADRDFLTAIAGGKFASKGAAEKSLDRLQKLTDQTRRNIDTAQQDIITRRSFSTDGAATQSEQGGKVIHFDDLPD